VKFGPVTPVV